MSEIKIYLWIVAVGASALIVGTFALEGAKLDCRIKLGNAGRSVQDIEQICQ